MNGYHGSTRIELGYNSRHEPDVFTPKIFSGRSNKNGCQSTECTEKRQEDELRVSGIFILGETTKIGHVDGEGGEETNDVVESFHGRPTSVHSGRQDDRASDERSSTVGDNSTPDEQGQEARSEEH